MLKVAVFNNLKHRETASAHLCSVFSAAMCTGCISKNLTLNKNAQTKLTIGKWSSLLIHQQQLSHDQNKVKNLNILK